VLCYSSLYEIATLAEEVAAEKRVRECLSDLVSMRAEVAKKAADGKARDDVRGQRIIPDYSDVHKPAAEEAVVLRAQRLERSM
jgi:chorismate mutase